MILIGGAPFACGITKMLSAGSCVPIIGSFDFGMQPDRSGEFAVIDPIVPSTNSYWFSMLELMK